MNAEEKKSAARLIWQAAKALEDGHVSPEEGRYLALAAVDILQKVAPQTERAWARIAIEGAAVVCRGLAKELKEMSDDE